jgi:glycosyltransferase involved in cell wall biosynthesis
VATSIGAYGIDVRVGTDLHVTNDPVQFAAAIVALLGDEAARTAMGHAGRAVYERNHSADVFTEHVRAIARDAIADGCNQ